MKETTQPKIDLAEIEELASYFRSSKDELSPRELVVLADALEALLKAYPLLIKLKANCEFDDPEFNIPDLNDLLDSFTNKTLNP